LAPVFWCLLLGARFLACSLPSYRRVLGGMFEGRELWRWHHARQRWSRNHAAKEFQRARIRHW
jgi:hypothetical protein